MRQKGRERVKVSGEGNVEVYSPAPLDEAVSSHLRRLAIIDMILDGELYSHTLTFQEITSAVKRDEPNELTEQIHMVLYDRIVDKPYPFRLDTCTEVANKLTNFDVIQCEGVADESGIDEWLGKFIQEGYEGAIIRNLEGSYKINGRSNDLLKYKKFIDEEYSIVDVIEGKGKFEGMGIFECELKDGRRFRATPAATEEEKRDFLRKKTDVIGKMVTVRYFELTDGK